MTLIPFWKDLTSLYKSGSHATSLDAYYQLCKPDPAIVVLDLRTVIAQHPDFLGQVRVVRYYRPAIAQGAQILAGIKAEAGGIA